VDDDSFRSNHRHRSGVRAFMPRHRIPGALVLSLVLLALGSTAASAQGTFYVATTGSDATGDGSIGSPWRTIRKALDNVPDGSLVLVRPGTYTGVNRLVGNSSRA